MPHPDALVVSPGPDGRSVRTASGQILVAPEDWALLPPGDAALTRRVRDQGPSWTIQYRKGNKTFSGGVWAPRRTIEIVQRGLNAQRATPEHARKKEADALRRAREQAAYMANFHQAVVDFLAFAPRYAPIAERLAKAVTLHAAPVGSGTVARTERIPIEERASAAVIAWMRHQTTGYDDMVIPRVKGQRREVRRMLAQRSQTLLDLYRTGQEIDPERCPLWLSLIGRRP
jgi:hypothetical protein